LNKSMIEDYEHGFLISGVTAHSLQIQMMPSPVLLLF